MSTVYVNWPSTIGQKWNFLWRQLSTSYWPQLLASNFLYSLHREGAMAAYRARANPLDIKWHGIWSSNAFWVYITTPCVATSPVTRVLQLALATMASWLFLCIYSLHVHLVCLSSVVLPNYLCFASLTLYLVPWVLVCHIRHIWLCGL